MLTASSYSSTGRKRDKPAMNAPIHRRTLLRASAAGMGALTISQFLAACGAETSPPVAAPATLPPTQIAEEPTMPQPTSTYTPVPAPTVYMTGAITSESLLAAYRALGREATGKVAVKLSTGEPGGHYYLDPDLIKDLVHSVDGTIVECNTTYGGQRDRSDSHRRAAEAHGFTAIAAVDIMDEEGEISLPVANGKHLTEDIVGAHIADYDFMIVLSHFKGHQMGGFGGAIKNISIGIASSDGKKRIHNAGKELTYVNWGTPQDDFLESMAEAAKAVVDYEGDNILYVNVMNNLSIDCDCDAHPAAPTMADIGILASLDPVALDQACVDLVYAAPDGKDLIARMEQKHGVHTLEHAAAIGVGSQTYQLVMI